MTREQAINSLIAHGFSVEQVGKIIKAVTPQFSSGLDKNSKKLEKDFGESDCISREQALVAIRNLYPGMPRVDFSGSLRKWVDKYKPYIECDDAIKQLPSVTPQLSVPEVTALAEWTEKLTKECEEAYNKGYEAGRKELEPITSKDKFIYAKDLDGAVKYNWLYEQIKEVVEDGNDDKQ